MENLIKYYSHFDEWGRLDREPLEFWVNCHHIKKHLPEHGHILDNGAGPGKYAIELAKMGYDMTLADLTPRLVEVARDKAQEMGVEQRYRGFYTMDARDLSHFPDQHFDAALMLGPLYHLQDEKDRTQAVSELYRVTRPGGVVFAAFMTRTRFLRASLLFPEQWKPNHTARGISEFMDTGRFDHEDEGRFTGAFYFDIDEIRPFMELRGFETVQLIGSSSIAGAMSPEQWDYWRKRGELEEIMEIVLQESGNPYLLGTSSHLLYIGKKPEVTR